jgi:hypothetical protein
MSPKAAIRSTPVHPGRSAPAKLAFANYEPAIDSPRGFNARKPCVAALPRSGKNLTEISAQLPAAYKAAANIVPAATLKLRTALTLVEFPIE